jgi:O-acetylserine/cysteine efflux transporter
VTTDRQAFLPAMARLIRVPVMARLVRATSTTRRGHSTPLTSSTIPIGGLIQLLGSVVLLSSAWPLTKVALAAGSTPLWFAEGRAVLSGLAACLLLAVIGRLRVPTRPDLPAMFAIGGLQLGTYLALAHEAVAWVPAGRTAILANTTTIWVVPLSLIFLREPIPARRWLAAALGLTGVAVLINPLAIDWSSGSILIGHVFLLGAGLSWSIAIIVTRAARPNLSMFELLPWCFLIGSLVLAPLVWWHAPHGTVGDNPASWWALGYIGLIAGPLGTWCVMEATAKLPTLVSSVGFLTTPAISLILANILLHEPFTPDLLAGSALIMTGVVAAAWPQRRPA